MTTDFLDQARGYLELSSEMPERNADLGIWTAQEATASALIAIAEQLTGVNDNLDLLRQAIELMIDGEPIDDSPIDAADPVTCSVYLARLDKCECVDKVPRQ